MIHYEYTYIKKKQLSLIVYNFTFHHYHLNPAKISQPDTHTLPYSRSQNLAIIRWVNQPYYAPLSNKMAELPRLTFFLYYKNWLSCHSRPCEKRQNFRFWLTPVRNCVAYMNVCKQIGLLSFLSYKFSTSKNLEDF